jgi:hypothetical protein
MAQYWLHILESRSTGEPKTPSTYFLVKSFAPMLPVGGSLPTVHHPTWAQLAGRLSNCGVPARELERAKAVLDSQGSYQLTEISLTDEQVKALGFVT